MREILKKIKNCFEESRATLFVFLNSAINLLDICSLSQNSFYGSSCGKDRVASDELELKIVNAKINFTIESNFASLI